MAQHKLDRHNKNEMELDQIKQAIHAVLNERDERSERDGMGRDRHRQDHDWTYVKRKEEARDTERRTEARDKIKATVIGGLGIALLTGLGTVVYNIGKFVIDLYNKSHTGQ